MQRSLSALLTATLAIPVVGYFTHAQLSAESQPRSTPPLQTPPLQITLQKPDSGHFGTENDRSQGRDLWLQSLDLTPAQHAQIQALQANAQPDLTALTERLSTEQNTLEALISSDRASAEALRVQYQVLQELHQAVAANRFEVLLAMREVLTPEQRTLLTTQIEPNLEHSRHALPDRPAMLHPN